MEITSKLSWMVPHPPQHQLCQVSPKALSWVHCYSSYISMISHRMSSPGHASLLITVACVDNSLADAKALQEDLDNLQQWEKDWLMEYNIDKCEVILITNKRKVVDSEYTIHVQILRHTDKAKYPGVTIDSPLSWNHHIDTITKKANNTTAFLRRNFSSCPPDVKATFYKALVPSS